MKAFLSSPWVLGAWIAIVVACLLDLRRRNPQVQALMRVVWILAVAYAGPLGLTVYATTGRRQIARDSIWRRGGRSVAHCYAGCGLGEIARVPG